VRVLCSYGVVASVYSIAQIVGGVAIGFLSDAVLGRRGTLLLSMVGAGVAYYMVAIAQTLPVLIASRVLVGLVKQTMTASTAVRAGCRPLLGRRHSIFSFMWGGVGMGHAGRLCCVVGVVVLFVLFRGADHGGLDATWATSRQRLVTPLCCFSRRMDIWLLAWWLAVDVQSSPPGMDRRLCVCRRCRLGAGADARCVA